MYNLWNVSSDRGSTCLCFQCRASQSVSHTLYCWLISFYTEIPEFKQVHCMNSVVKEGKFLLCLTGLFMTKK